MPEFQDLQEVENMLAGTVAYWKDAWLAEGTETCLSKGHTERKLKTLAENIRILMEPLGLTKEKAMDLLKVSDEARKSLASAL